jgi:alpha-mannosidase
MKSELFLTLQKRIALLDKARYKNVIPLDNWQIIDQLETEEAQPAADDPRWQSISVGDKWGSLGRYAWFRTQLPPSSGEGQPALLLEFFNYAQSAPDGIYEYTLMRPEGIVYGDGVTLHAVNRGHDEVLLNKQDAHQLHVLVAGGYSPEQRRLHRAQYVTLDVDLDGLYWDAATILGSTEYVNPSEGQSLLRELEQILARFDWRHPLPSTAVKEAREALQVSVFATKKDAPVVHALGYGHLDLAWLWPLSYSLGKGIRTSIAQLELMESFPDFTFTMSQPQIYKAFQRANPELFEQIKARIQEGRWNATGAMWVQPDTNLPNGESLIRQFLFGMRYFEQELGVTPKVLWLPDSFGFSGTLPQLMQQAGVPYMFTSKLSWNRFNQHPSDTFIWQGIDGTEVLVHQATTHREGRVQTIYEGELTPFEVWDTWESYRQKENNQHVFIAYGYGDGGGGPSREFVERLQRYQAGIPGMPEVRSNSVENFFETLESELSGTLPRWVGELYLEFHQGCFTSQARTKRYNRKLEGLLHDAEFLSAWASQSCGLSYSQEAINSAWETLLTHQFHDILPGSSIREAYIEVEAGYEEAVLCVQKVIENSLEALCGAVDGEGWIVFNALGHSWSPLVEVEVAGNSSPDIEFFDASGYSCPTQRLDNGRMLIASKDIAPYGYTVLESRPAKAGSFQGSLSASPQHLENAYVRVEFDSTGGITRIYDKETRRELIAPGAIANELQLFQDFPNRFDAWEIDFQYRLPNPELTSIKVVESGPLRASLEMTYAFGDSTIRQWVRLAENSPLLHFDTELDWHEQHTLLKAAFPLDMPTAHATFESQFGAVERPNHRNTSWDAAKYEVPAQRWADLSEGDYGAALLNDCKYGYDVLGSTLRLSVLRSPTWPDPQADQGHHMLSYALFPHTGDWRNGVVEAAEEFNASVYAKALPAQKKDMASTSNLPTSFLYQDAGSGIVIDTVKKAEDSEELIIRLYEPHGKRQSIVLNFGYPVTEFMEVNLLEQPIDNSALEVATNKLQIMLKPFQVRTFRVTFAKPGTP